MIHFKLYFEVNRAAPLRVYGAALSLLMWRFIPDSSFLRVSNSAQRRGRISPYALWGLALAASVVALPRIGQWLTQDIHAAALAALGGPAIEAEGGQPISMWDEQGHKVWEFTAKKVTISADHQFCTATDVRNATLYRNGQPYLKLAAQQVRLNEITKDMEAMGAVRASGPDGFSVRTERADWTQAGQRLDCPGPVHATLQHVSFDTNTVFYDAKLSQLHCPQMVDVASIWGKLRGANIIADAKTPHRIKFQQGAHIAILPAPH